MFFYYILSSVITRNHTTKLVRVPLLSAFLQFIAARFPLIHKLRSQLLTERRSASSDGVIELAIEMSSQNVHYGLVGGHHDGRIWYLSN